MFYSIWLLAAALAGWAGGKIAGDNGFGTLADILLGITGAFVVRWSLENIGISLHDVYLLLFSIWVAAAFPAALRLGIRRHNRSKNAVPAPGGLARDDDDDVRIQLPVVTSGFAGVPQDAFAAGSTIPTTDGVSDSLE